MAAEVRRIRNWSGQYRFRSLRAVRRWLARGHAQRLFATRIIYLLAMRCSRRFSNSTIMIAFRCAPSATWMDVSDIKHPKEVAQYEVPEGGSHNFWAANDMLYEGYLQRRRTCARHFRRVAPEIFIGKAAKLPASGPATQKASGRICPSPGADNRAR